MARRDSCAECGAVVSRTDRSAAEIMCHSCRRVKLATLTYLCEHCGEVFDPPRRRVDRAQRFCSRRCMWSARPADPHRNQRKCSNRRARLAAVEYEEIDPGYVFARDNWRCHICHRKVTKSGDPAGDRYATLDHLIPLALDGPHTYANIATACRRCNSVKGARAIGEQLALVG